MGSVGHSLYHTKYGVGLFRLWGDWVSYFGQRLALLHEGRDREGGT